MGRLPHRSHQQAHEDLVQRRDMGVEDEAGWDPPEVYTINYMPETPANAYTRMYNPAMKPFKSSYQDLLEKYSSDDVDELVANKASGAQAFSR